MWVKAQDHKIVGRCLADARKSAGVTQDELAVRLGKPQSLVSAYERGQRRLDIVEFYVVMDALKLDPKPVLETIALQTADIVRRVRRPSAKKAKSSR